MALTDVSATAPRSDGSSKLPLVAIGFLIVFIGVINFFAEPLFAPAALVGIAGVLVVTTEPAYAVVIMLGSFLVTYPSWMQGVGPVTLNNALGAWMLAMMIYRVNLDGDYSVLRNRRLQLMALITGILLASRFIHRPDQHTMQLVIPLQQAMVEEDPMKIIIDRLIFLLFMIYFIRTPMQLRTLFALAIVLMVASGLAGIQNAMAGTSFAGYRASSAQFIQSAGNPNRLALAAVISVITLWSLVQWLKNWIVTVVLSGVMAAEMLAIFMTGSRSGVVALALALGLLFIEGGISLRKILGTVLAFMMAGLLVLNFTPEKALERVGNIPGIQSDSDIGSGSTARRTYVAEMALSMFELNPLFGVGIGNWDITRYLNDPEHDINPAHNSLLTTLVEGGIVTLLLYFLMLFLTCRTFLICGRAVTVNPQDYDGWTRWMARSLRVSFVVFMAMSVVGDLWTNIIFYWFIGLGVVLPRLMFAPEERADAEPEQVFVGAAA